MKLSARLAFFYLLAAPVCISAPPLSMAGSPEADSAESAALFDGAAKRQVKTEKPSPAAEDTERLAAEFKKHLAINDHGSAEERAALDSMISKMMKSATAREVAVKFIEENAEVALSLEEIPGSTVVTEDGKKTFWGTRGQTYIQEDPPRVQLNKLFMQYDKDFGIGTLAHEMLGHAFEKQRAGKALKGKLGKYQYDANENDEENARLIGWLVRTELGIKPEDEIWDHLQDPEANMRSLKMSSPAYAIELASSEMKDPVPVYTSRLADADKGARKLIENAGNYITWNKVIDHFVNGHKMDPAPFQAIRDDISNRLNSLPAKQKKFEKIKSELQAQLDYFAGAEGKAVLEELAKESGNDYFERKDAVIKERRKRLEGLLLGKTPESFKTPPAVGEITWKQLAELWGNDRRSCSSAAEVFK